VRTLTSCSRGAEILLTSSVLDLTVIFKLALRTHCSPLTDSSNKKIAIVHVSGNDRRNVGHVIKTG
jgi:hypothetical protein